MRLEFIAKIYFLEKFPLKIKIIVSGKCKCLNIFDFVFVTSVYLFSTFRNPYISSKNTKSRRCKKK